MLNNWLAILSLAVALIGAIPGIVALVTLSRDRPGFHASLSNFINGMCENGGGQTQVFVLLALTLANPKRHPLLPCRFELVLRLADRLVPCIAQLVPDGVQFNSMNQRIEILEPWKSDLQRFTGAITPNCVLNGFLFFNTPDGLTQQELSTDNIIAFELTCIDAFGVRFTSEIIPNFNTNDQKTVYPKHQMVISQPPV